MVNENKILFYSEELNEDVRQNNNLLNTKEVLTQNNIKEQIHSNSYTYSSIVDTRDYLGCINGNCSKITCDCKDSNCDCKHSNTNNSNTNNSNTNIKKTDSPKNTISDLVDFVFVLFIAIFLFHILYNKKSEQLLYVLGITNIFVFYKIYIVSN